MPIHSSATDTNFAPSFYRDLSQTRDEQSVALREEQAKSQRLSDTLTQERLALSKSIAELSNRLSKSNTDFFDKQEEWSKSGAAKDRRVAELERASRDSKARIDSLTKDLNVARDGLTQLKKEKEEQATSHAKELKESSNASDKKCKTEIKKRLAEQKAELTVDSLPATSQMLRSFIHSQFTSIGISEDDNRIDDVAREWNALLDTTPTMRAGVEVPLGQYTLTFVVSPVEVVTMQAADAALAQIWLLLKSNPDVLLSIRHFALRSDVSASQLNVLQDILLKGIGVITEGAYCQEVFARILVAVHALGWLYVRVGALSDSVERRSALVNTWNHLSFWLLTKKAASEILYQVCVSTFGSFEARFGVSKGVLSIERDKADWLDSSNSALEGDQWLVADPAMHTAAWGVGGSMRVFGRADVRCVEFHLVTDELTLHFRGSDMEICLCRQTAHLAHIWGLVRNLMGDDSCFKNVGI